MSKRDRIVAELSGEIDGARLHRVEKGWHLLALGDGADEERRVQLEFLHQHVACGN